MSMRMELSDLPPKYRAQAEAQIAARSRAKAPPLEAVAAAAKKTGREFDSRGVGGQNAGRRNENDFALLWRD